MLAFGTQGLKNCPVVGAPTKPRGTQHQDCTAEPWGPWLRTRRQLWKRHLLLSHRGPYFLGSEQNWHREPRKPSWQTHVPLPSRPSVHWEQRQGPWPSGQHTSHPLPLARSPGCLFPDLLLWLRFSSAWNDSLGTLVESGAVGIRYKAKTVTYRNPKPGFRTLQEVIWGGPASHSWNLYTMLKGQTDKPPTFRMKASLSLQILSCSAMWLQMAVCPFSVRVLPPSSSAISRLDLYWLTCITIGLVAPNRSPSYRG